MPQPMAPTFAEALARIRDQEHHIRAFVRTRLDEAAEDHQRLQREPARSELHGLPYSLKDLWDTAGITTTGGSARYADRVPKDSSPVHEVFEEAGAVLLGKTNTSDLGLAMESQSYVGSTTKNPHALERTAGGSSGGAAAAVAAGMSAFDWGSDFGGSIRLPSAFCGVYGMRLSSEAWPLLGHFPEPPPSLRFMNGQGPITARLEVMRALLDRARPRLRTGPTRRFELRGAYLWSPSRAVAGQWPSFEQDVRPVLEKAAGEVRGDHRLLAPERALDLARAMYCSHLEDFAATDDTSIAEGLGAVLSSLLFRGRFGDRRFHPRTAEMLLLIALGRATLYRNAQRAERDAEHWRSHLSGLWDRGYVVVAPTTTFPAPRHGRVARTIYVGAFNMPGNLADVTGLAVPFGRYPDGLPRSLQIWGPPGSEETLLSIAERMAG